MAEIRESDALVKALCGNGYLVLDGAMGSMIQEYGLKSSSSIPDMLSIEQPEEIINIHKAYVDAGAQVITSNTFGSSSFKLHGAAPVEDVIEAGLSCARASGAQYVALDLGPLGAFLEPLGDITEEEAYEYFAQQVRAAMASPSKPDLILVETMTDLAEIEAAVQAAKDNSDLPVLATMSFDENGYTMMGVTPEAAAQKLDELGVAALGINCSVGPRALARHIARMRAVTKLPLIAQPNAGLPQYVDGETRYSLGVEEFTNAYAGILDAGATIVGSCCGTTPDYTAALCKLVEDLRVSK